MQDRIAIGKHVRAFRGTKGWTQEELAIEAGVSQSLVGKVELGQSVRDTSLQKVLAVTGKTLALNASDGVEDSAAVKAARALPADLDAIAARFMRIFPHVPERRRQQFIGRLAIWEEDYAPSKGGLLADDDTV